MPMLKMCRSTTRLQDGTIPHLFALTCVMGQTLLHDLGMHDPSLNGFATSGLLSTSLALFLGGKLQTKRMPENWKVFTI
jgi:hypothetical protein